MFDLVSVETSLPFRGEVTANDVAFPYHLAVAISLVCWRDANGFSNATYSDLVADVKEGNSPLSRPLRKNDEEH